MQIFVLGRFPPPLDGGTLATRRLAELLDPIHTIHRINTEPPGGTHLAAEVRFRPDRVRHYAGLARPIRAALQTAPSAPVLWTSISPVLLGHWRDMLTIYPALAPEQAVYGVSHRATFHEAFHSPLTRPTARLLVRRLAGFVFLTEQFAERCTPWIPDAKRFVIPNTIDDALLCGEDEIARKVDRPDQRALQLLFLSNMMPEKGYRDVLKMLPILRAHGVAFHAHFAGRWVTEVDRTNFDAFIAAHRLQANVTHYGGLSDREQIRRLHLQADAFLLPSYHPTEAQPLSIIEALSAGTPVVTTMHGGMPDMIRPNRDGLFVPPRDPEALAEAVRQLSQNDHWKTLSRSARRRFQERFSPAAVRQQWENLIARPHA